MFVIRLISFIINLMGMGGVFDVFSVKGTLLGATMVVSKRPVKKPRVRRTERSYYDDARSAVHQRPPHATNGYGRARKGEVLTRGFVNGEVSRKKSGVTATRIVCLLIGLSIMFYSGVVIAFLALNDRLAASGYMALFFVLGLFIARGNIRERIKNIPQQGLHKYDSYNS